MPNNHRHTTTMAYIGLGVFISSNILGFFKNDWAQSVETGLYAAGMCSLSGLFLDAATDAVRQAKNRIYMPPEAQNSDINNSEEYKHRIEP